MKRFAVLTAVTVTSVGMFVTGCAGTKTGTNLGRAIDGNNYGTSGYYYYDDYYYPGTTAGTASNWNGRYYDANGNRYFGDTGLETRTDAGYGYNGANGYAYGWDGTTLAPASTAE